VLLLLQFVICDSPFAVFTIATRFNCLYHCTLLTTTSSSSSSGGGGLLLPLLVLLLLH
jgi:hypothetical protein